jgi:2-oxoglutarate dehydrogenase E2 component (dihydrolipoamide succinyltransferase)
VSKDSSSNSLVILVGFFMGMPELSNQRPSADSYATPELQESFRRVPMGPLRETIARRLLHVTQHTAMLTTFNDINMSKLILWRSDYQEMFVTEHGVKLGYMSFFIKALCEAIKHYPILNASIDGHDILYHNEVHLSVAVSTDHGLVVPVLKSVQNLGLGAIEKALAGIIKTAREGRLTLEQLQGGTFTLTNGGVFGSLLSTPLINPPQSAILGMHRIEDRPIVKDGQVISAPMMYVALSYDHQLIDGRDAVGFLDYVKKVLETPERLILA